MEHKDKELLKLLFIANDDIVYQKVVSFLTYPKISQATMGVLFYQDDINKYFNCLEFCELFNEQHDYLSHWCDALKMISTNSSWLSHRAKVISRFSRFHDVTPATIDYFKELKKTNDSELKMVINTTYTYLTIFQNTLVKEMKDYRLSMKSYAHNEGYYDINTITTKPINYSNNESNYSDIQWLLWRIIQRYIEKDNHGVIKLLKEYNLPQIKSLNELLIKETNFKSDKQLLELYKNHEEIIAQVPHELEKLRSTAKLFSTLSSHDTGKLHKNKI